MENVSSDKITFLNTPNPHSCNKQGLTDWKDHRNQTVAMEVRGSTTFGGGTDNRPGADICYFNVYLHCFVFFLKSRNGR